MKRISPSAMKQRVSRFVLKTKQIGLSVLKDLKAQDGILHSMVFRELPIEYSEKQMTPFGGLAAMKRGQSLHSITRRVPCYDALCLRSEGLQPHFLGGDSSPTERRSAPIPVLSPRSERLSCRRMGGASPIC